MFPHVCAAGINLFLNQSSKTTTENTGAVGIKRRNENEDKVALLNIFKQPLLGGI